MIWITPKHNEEISDPNMPPGTAIDRDLRALPQRFP
jgi:hypothetical protein